MPRKLARDILASVAIFACVLAAAKTDFVLAKAMRPYVAAVLTESTDFSRLAGDAHAVAAKVLKWNPWSSKTGDVTKPGAPAQPDIPAVKQTDPPEPRGQTRVAPAGGGPEGGSPRLDSAVPGTMSPSLLLVDDSVVRASSLPDGALARPEARLASAGGASSGGGAPRDEAEPVTGQAGKTRENAKAGPGARKLPGLAVPTHGQVTYGFGYRIHPIYERRLFHEGLDIAAPVGASIRAAAAGTVERVGAFGTYGLVVEIDHGCGLTTLYAHCSRTVVRSGERVRTGQKVAEVGSTGLSTGPHLHFEVAVYGKAEDPFAYLEGGKRDRL